MGTIARTTKAGGGTNFNSGQTIDPAEVNTDFNTVYTELNGLLDDGNVETATVPGAKSLRFTEITDPSTPASNDLLLYAKDASGTTRLYTQDSTGTVTAIAGGTTGYLLLPLSAATLPDASGSGNNPPAPRLDVSATAQTSNTPKASQLVYLFDATTDEHLLFRFRLPGDWGSGGSLRLTWRADTATSGNVVWKAGVAPTTDASTDDKDPTFTAADVSSASAAPGTLDLTVTLTITLTMTNAAAHRMLTLFVGRDADHASDTMAGDAVLVGLSFEYTRA